MKDKDKDKTKPVASKTSLKYEGVRSKNTKDGDISYYVRYVDKSGKRVEVKVGTKASGWNEKKASLKRLELMHFTPYIEANELTISDIIPRYLEVTSLHVNARCLSEYSGEALNHINPFFGSLKIDDITESKINDYLLTLKDKKSPVTINKTLNRLKAIIDFGIKEYALPFSNPLKDIKKLKVDNARERFLKSDEVELLLKVARAHANAEIYLFVALSLSMGGRFETVRNIKLEDIDLEAEVIKLVDFKNKSKYNGFLTPTAKQALKAFTLQDKSDKSSNILFKTPARTLKRHLQDILNALFNKDLDKNDRKHRVVIHSLRHTFASHLAIKGTPIQIIQKLLNHKDIKMTMRYAHLLPTSGKEWVSSLWD
ncbi:site-specific integrase [Helicobacter sp. 11S02629-2]|uniref:tyrosine-type recombinase/integrase n=1 Tax=Helicobacter sp. 11S02629-2 TaxID=1476195 RepID=UPI000BA77E69|nr:site-specific integrase [Helicobacter sp. 11S02629-2]PAF44144.1 hypothetical protein BKH40_05990 [Helicobacter sp. 11S02629-2]